MDRKPLEEADRPVREAVERRIAEQEARRVERVTKVISATVAAQESPVLGGRPGAGYLW
ncbi:hypothetical protein AB0D45_21395 [Streptomyces sp. NPDC048352]|uniref:hypothetical protein n=1 Tax=Streptomyces sp. NPDC048352 TaxID=3154718 RepID=UPI003440178A